MAFFSEADPSFLYAHTFSAEDQERLPYYSELARSCSESPVACQLLSEVREQKRNPMLIFAILRFHALSGHRALTPLYDNFHDFEPSTWARRVLEVLEADPELIRSEYHRSTQTNEPNRSAALVVILGELMALGLDDVHLIDVGCSMGFNLYPDYAELAINSVPRHKGQLVTRSKNGHALKTVLPTIHQRIGIDANPLDSLSDDDVRWLNACIWLEDRERIDRFTYLLEQMPNLPDARRIQGNAVDLIERVVDELDDSAVPVIFHSWVVAYFNEDEQRRWRSEMDKLVARGAVWISFESTFAVQGLELPEPTTIDPNQFSVQLVVALPGQEPRHAGWAHPHARWIELATLTDHKSDDKERHRESDS